MTFGNVLNSLILGPLTILFESIFALTNTLISNPGLSIVALSLIMNILVLPLYKRADDMQEESRLVEAKLKKGVTHIKKHFTGDERMMILQAYYSENHYKPTHALKGSISLLLQIPFFMAAYNFLSNLADLQGASLGPISNLGAPDGLIVIGGLSINLLPILMTLINVISSAIYLKGFPLKTKIQIYGMAAFFLVFLYTSPSGLVFYWTLNNVFSLGKTIYYKLKVPSRVIHIAIAVAGLGIAGFGAVMYQGAMRTRVCLIGLGVLMQIAWFWPTISRRLEGRVRKTPMEPNKKLFVAGSALLSVLVGALVSSTYIAASPQEFVDVTYFYHPLWYVLNTLCLSAGTFMIWMRVFYWLAKPKTKIVMERGVWILSGVMLMNYMFFGLNLGNLSPMLQYETGMNFAVAEKLLNTVLVLVVAVVLYLFVKKWGKVATNILVVVTVVIGAMSLKNTFDIKKSIDAIVNAEDTTELQFQLDKDGQNVVVIMLDRAVGEYVPYILNEKPELKEQFDGFTYYSNTISFGDHTNFCVPSLMGGYEYTPVELNSDASRSLVDKHNEALKVMPVLFSQNGFDVTVSDPPYANYNWIPDLSIYDEHSDIQAFNSNGRFNSEEQKEYSVEAKYRNFFCFSLMKCMPVMMQSLMYEGGNYFITAKTGEPYFANQIMSGLSAARGYADNFMNSYNTLSNLSTMTNITSTGKNTFMVMSNEITHFEQLLQTPDYVPVDKVDNREYDEAHSDRFTLSDGSTLEVTTDRHIKSYHSHMAALIQIGKWLDYLKENGVYDNTRIIIASDHGHTLFQSDDLAFDDPNFASTSAEDYFPLLMVKDFNSEGFTISDEFMTNADVPTLATNGVIENPLNPFTGNPINSDEKTAHDQYIIVSTNWDISKNQGNTFEAARWISVSEDLWNKDKWEFYNEEVVLKEHAFPE